MNEVEKMYSNAGVKSSHYDACKIADAYWLNEELANEYGTFDNYMKLNCIYHYQECTDECRHAYDRDVYPPFTAEKQLELIKWLAQKDYGNYAESLLISIRDGYNYLSVGITTDFGSEYFHEAFTFDNKQFDEAIAGLINKLWKKLTDAERTQIKEILE